MASPDLKTRVTSELARRTGSRPARPMRPTRRNDRPDRNHPSGQDRGPKPAPIGRPTNGGNTGPGAHPGGPRESGPFGIPNVQQLIDEALSRLSPEEQAIARQHLAHIPETVQAQLDALRSQFPNQAGMLGFHPSLDHSHGPDGAMLPAIGAGGLAPNRPTPPAPSLDGFRGRFATIQPVPSTTGAPKASTGVAPGSRPIPTPRDSAPYERAIAGQRARA